MTNLSSLSGFNPHSSVYTVMPPVLNEHNLSSDIAGMEDSNISQYDANSFIIGGWHKVNNSYPRFRALPFHISNTGTVTAGSVYSYNVPSGDDSISTVHTNETAPGVLSSVGRMDWSGSYQIVGASASTTDGLTLTSTGVTNYGNHSSTNTPHPQGGGIIGPGTWTANTHVTSRYESYIGYVNYGHFGSFYGVGYSKRTDQSLDSYSSTSGSAQFIQHYSDSSSRMGWGYNHESADDYHFNTVYSTNTISDKGDIGNYGETNNTNYNGGLCYIDRSDPNDSNNKAVWISAGGRCWEWNKTGGGQSECTISGFPHQSCAINRFAKQLGCTMAGKNLVWLSGQNFSGLYSFTRDTSGSSPHYAFTQIGPLMGHQAFFTFGNEANLDNTSRIYDRLRFCGDQNQFIMILSNNKIKLYDATEVYPGLGSYLS